MLVRAFNRSHGFRELCGKLPILVTFVLIWYHSQAPDGAPRRVSKIHKVFYGSLLNPTGIGHIDDMAATVLFSYVDPKVCRLIIQVPLLPRYGYNITALRDTADRAGACWYRTFRWE
jgi:hypothetical protein